MYLKAIILAGSIIAASAASAHSHGKGSSKGPNGGAVSHAGNYHVELVAKGTSVDVFVTDAKDKPVPAERMKATAILLVKGKSQRVELEPAEGSRLSGEAPVPLPAHVKGAVRLTSPNGKTAQAKFN
ncbi:MAG TPA: hypothetical protein VE665_04230 [Hyphomicrobiaceae bacterium]|jgi:hypothetical protein|nr:hypothetical protein [Hyphomicrobiaceae bacterium]